jgi:hypothetical protein
MGIMQVAGQNMPVRGLTENGGKFNGKESFNQKTEWLECLLSRSCGMFRIFVLEQWIFVAPFSFF